MVGLRDPKWLQGALNMLICLLYWYGLEANVAKYRSMTYKLGTLRSKMLEESVEQRCTEIGATYQERLRRRIPCTDCRVDFTAGSMTAHRQCMIGTEPKN